MSDLSQEIWKDIKGYEGLYQVSNLGRVRSFRNNHNRKRILILKYAPNKHGYLQICLYKNKNKKTYFIHRLVAEHFIDNPNGYKEINHKDENPSNNQVKNLEWCDRKYNINYGKRSEKCSKSVSQYDLYGNFIKSYKSLTEAAETLNINKKNMSNVSDVCNGKRKTAYKYIWKWNGGK